MPNQQTRYCRTCGGRLARDNPSVHCGPCGKRAAASSVPPDVPAEFWDADPMRDALASWHIGQVIRAYRHHPWHGRRALPQEVVGGWLGLTQAQLSRVEGGPAVTDLSKLVPWARMLKIPSQRLWFKLPGAPPKTEQTEDALVAAQQDAAEGSLLGSLGISSPEDEALRLVYALGHSNIAPHTLEFLESEVVRVAQVYSSVAPPSLLTWAQKRLATIVALLKGSQPIVQRRRLCVLAGQIAGLRAWLAHDLHQTAAATGLYGAAMMAAREAGDEALCAWVLGNHSRIPIYEDKARVALDLIEEALEHAEGHASATTRAWLLAQASRAHTALHDHASGARALAQAERVLDSASGDTSREIVYFDGCRLMSFVGHHHLLAGQPQLAEAHLRASLAMLRPEQVKHVSLTRLDLASVLVAQREPAEACDQAVSALSIPREHLIDSVVRRAAHLREELVPYARQLAEARDVVEMIDDMARYGIRA